MLFVVTKMLSHGTPGIWCNVLHWRRVGSICSDNSGILHGSVCLKLSYNLCYRRCFLPNGNINTIDRFIRFVSRFLIDDGVHRNSGFSCLPITDNQFSLSTSNRNHGINGFYSRLQGLIYRTSLHHTQCFSLNG